MDYTYEYCVCNENITEGELQDVIEELMDQEFDTICEDGSVVEICKHLLRYKHMSLQGLYEQIEAELSKLPQGQEWLRKDVKMTYTPIAGESSSDEDSEESSGDEEGMDVDGPSTSNRIVTRSQGRNQEEEFVEPEEGWTTVRGRRK